MLLLVILLIPELQLIFLQQQHQDKTFLVKNQNNEIITKLKPENRFYPITGIFTTEASIHTNLLRDLYIVMGDGNKEDGWVIKIYHNPLVIWIWIGAFVIFLGGITSTNINMKKIKILSK